MGVAHLSSGGAEEVTLTARPEDPPDMSADLTYAPAGGRGLFAALWSAERPRDSPGEDSHSAENPDLVSQSAQHHRLPLGWLAKRRLQGPRKALGPPPSGQPPQFPSPPPLHTHTLPPHTHKSGRLLLADGDHRWWCGAFEEEERKRRVGHRRPPLSAPRGP